MPALYSLYSFKVIRMGKFTIGQLCTVASLLLSIRAQNIGLGRSDTTEKAQFQITRGRTEKVSLDESQPRSKDSLAKKKDDDILSLDNSHTKVEETDVSRKERERRRRKRKRRKKSEKRRRGKKQTDGRRRRKKHLREEEPFERAELKKRERMRRRRRLYEEQKEFQR